MPGAIVMLLVIWAIDALGAPRWVVALPWLAPTIGAMIRAVARPTPAIPSDDDDDHWTSYAIRSVMIGRDEPRPLPLRLLAAIVFGAPVVWAISIVFVFELAGIF